MKSQFPFNLDIATLLLDFEKVHSLQEFSQLLGRDISVISRQLKRASEVYPILEKVHGRWKLTELGRKLNDWTRETINSQRQLLQGKEELRLATTREFAGRILVPQIHHLFDLEKIYLNIITNEGGVEDLLLLGKADVGIDCGRPYHPQLRFKRVVREKITLVASPLFIKKYKIKNSKDLKSLPHIQYSRNFHETLLQMTEGQLSILFNANDISCVRQAVLNHLGWAMIPYYTVKEELQAKRMKEIRSSLPLQEHFGVWWPSHRKDILPSVERILQWLASQKLS